MDLIIVIAVVHPEDILELSIHKPDSAGPRTARDSSETGFPALADEERRQRVHCPDCLCGKCPTRIILIVLLMPLAACFVGFALTSLSGRSTTKYCLQAFASGCYRPDWVQIHFV